MILWALLILLASPVLMGEESAPMAPYTQPKTVASPGESSSSMWQTNHSPAVQYGEAQGTIVSIDPVFRHITLRDDHGILTDFSLETNTPIQGYYSPSDLGDLHPGDRIAITYQLLPQQVKNVQKQSSTVYR